MKIPSSQRTGSGFHICDILELNKDKKSNNNNNNNNNADDSADNNSNNSDDSQHNKSDDKLDNKSEDDEIKIKTELQTTTLPYPHHMFQASRPWMYDSCNNDNGE